MLACSVYFVRRRVGRLFWDSLEITQKCRRTRCTEHESIRPSKRLELYFSRRKRYLGKKEEEMDRGGGAPHQRLAFARMSLGCMLLQNHALMLTERYCQSRNYYTYFSIGRTPSGSCNCTLLRRFSTTRCFLEGFLEGGL